jgi:hypothetical protein
LLTASIEYIYPFMSILEPVALTHLSGTGNGASRDYRGKCYTRGHSTATLAYDLASLSDPQAATSRDDYAILAFRICAWLKVVANTVYDDPFAELCAQCLGCLIAPRPPESGTTSTDSCRSETTSGLSHLANAFVNKSCIAYSGVCYLGDLIHVASGRSHLALSALHLFPNGLLLKRNCPPTDIVS